MRQIKQILFALVPMAIFLMASGFACDILCPQLSAQSKPEPPAEMTPRQVESLIMELQSDAYRSRQRASRKLTLGGPSIIRQLVEQVVAGPPESATRCAQILSQIALDSEQTEMTRIARIMLLLSENGFQHLRNDSLMLNRRWKQNQLERTLEKIRETGIQVDAVSAVGGFGGFDRLDASFSESPNEPPPRRPAFATSPVLSKSDLLAQVERIANASETENEEAFADKILAQSQQPSMEEPVPNEDFSQPGLVVIAGDGTAIRIRAGGIVMPNGIPVESEQSTFSVSIGDSFTGSGEQLALLKLLPAISQMTIDNRDLDKDFLGALGAGPRVDFLSLQSCKYELADIFEFMNACPETQITASGHDAFLGVRVVNAGIVDNGVYECVIESIVPETAAEKEGCLAGDIIESIDGYRIRSYDQLIVAIGSFRPDDEATFDFRREDKSFQKKITFLNRPPGQ